MYLTIKPNRVFCMEETPEPENKIVCALYPELYNNWQDAKGKGLFDIMVAFRDGKYTRPLLEEYTKLMEVCISKADTEGAHIEADAVLCQLLRELGYEKVVEKWYEVSKWY